MMLSCSQFSSFNCQVSSVVCFFLLVSFQLREAGPAHSRPQCLPEKILLGYALGTGLFFCPFYSLQAVQSPSAASHFICMQRRNSGSIPDWQREMPAPPNGAIPAPKTIFQSEREIQREKDWLWPPFCATAYRPKSFSPCP